MTLAALVPCSIERIAVRRDRPAADRDLAEELILVDIDDLAPGKDQDGEEGSACLVQVLAVPGDRPKRGLALMLEPGHHARCHVAQGDQLARGNDQARSRHY